jgi:MoaA/NifB/PqqE/SkfB family radical SAM enzyme
MYTIDDFLDSRNKIVVSYTLNHDDVMEFLKALEDRGVYWKGNIKPTKLNTEKDPDYAISYNLRADFYNVLGYSTVDDYTNQGFTVVSCSDILHKSSIKFDEEEFIGLIGGHNG